MNGLSGKNCMKSKSDEKLELGKSEKETDDVYDGEWERNIGKVRPKKSQICMKTRTTHRKKRLYKECLNSDHDSDNHDDELKIKRTEYCPISFTFWLRSMQSAVEWRADEEMRLKTASTHTHTARKKGIQKQIFHQKEFKVKCPKLKLFENS